MAVTASPDYMRDIISQESTEYEIVAEVDWGGGKYYAPQAANAGDGFARVHEATYNSAESAELDARLTSPNIGGIYDYYQPKVDYLGGIHFDEDGNLILVGKDIPACPWCRSRAADDARGNCGACGGPR